jgi:hypothetical protein
MHEVVVRHHAEDLAVANLAAAEAGDMARTVTMAVRTRMATREVMVAGQALEMVL